MPATASSKLAGQFKYNAHTIIDGQPDGSEIHLKDYSTEELTLQTTLDGYTVVRSSRDGFYYYAQLSENGSQLVPTGTKATAEPPNDLEQHITVEPENIRHVCGNSCLHDEQQSELNAQPDDRQARLANGQSGGKSTPSTAPEYSTLSSFAYFPGSVDPIGSHTGLTIVIGFPDDTAVTGDQSYLPRVEGVPGGTSVSYVDKMLNQVGFTQGSNIGSVYDYFLNQSGGQFQFTNVVAPEIMMPQPASFYTNLSTTSGILVASKKIGEDAINTLAASGYVIPASVSRDPANPSRIRALSIFYAGPTTLIQQLTLNLGGNYQYGTTGINFFYFQISGFFARQGMGRETASSGNSTFIHECGHLLFGWPDLYDSRYVSPNDNGQGVGFFCQMSGYALDLKRPSPLNPEFRILNGWATPVDVGVNEYLPATLPATGNVVYRVKSDAINPDDYFLVENIGTANPYSNNAPDKGIAIWHVDPLLTGTSNKNDNRTGDVSQPHYYISLKQADGLFNLENDTNTGDAGDLFDLAKPLFNSTTTPSSRFWSSALTDATPTIQILGNAGANINVQFGLMQASYPVTYNTSQSTSGTAPTEQAKLLNVNLTLATNSGDLARTGYTFAGWDTYISNLRKSYAEGGTYSTNSPAIFYPRWTVATYAVTYATNGSTSGSAPASRTKTHGADITLATNSGSLAKTGFTFVGWNTAANGSGTNYAAGATYTTNASLTLYARWVNPLPPVVSAGSSQTVTLSGTTPWTPAKISATAWFDGADATTITQSSGAVSQWNDKSGNNVHLVQANAVQRPITGTNQINGVNALAFDGSNDALKSATNPFGTTINNAMICGVFNIGAITSSTLFSLSGSGTSANRWQSHAPWSGGTVFFDCGDSGGTNRISTATSWAAGENKLLGFYCSTSENTQQVWTNGSLLQSDTSGHSVTTAGGLSLGYDGSSSSFDNCTIGEVVVLNGTVTPTNRQTLEGYLAHKWGMQSTLPADHPHKTNGPDSIPAATATLAGSASDPNSDPITHTWSFISGPSAVSFGNANALNSSATFITPGTYVLRLTATDGITSVTSNVTITVNATPFQIWAAANNITSIPTANTDSDSSNQLLEYAFGTDPNLPGGGAINYVADGALLNPGLPDPRNLAIDGGVDFHAVFTRRKDHFAAGLTYTVQFSADLTLWENSTDTPTILTGNNTQNPGNIEAVSVPFPLLVPISGGDKKPTFFRVNVSMP